MRQFAISDIHGCIDTFRALLYKIEFSKEDELYLLGDYIDRGPDSKGVIDHIFKLRKEGYTVHCLLGNHEKMMLDARFGMQHSRLWLRNGGAITLNSFKAIDFHDISDKYWDFLKELPYYIEIEGYILVHAALDFKSDDPFGDKNTLIWGRRWHDDIDKNWLGKRYIVHGHTPTPMEDIKGMFSVLPQFQALNIDAGCFAVHRSYQGQLCAFDMTNKELIFQKNIDDMSDWLRLRKAKR